jgi:magnesium-transporting ATPase (P-type)
VVLEGVGDGHSTSKSKSTNTSTSTGVGVTDMARGAAGIVLRDGDLAALAACIKRARRLYAGVQVAAAHALACHVSLALLWPPLLYLSAEGTGARRGAAAMDALPQTAVQLLVLEALRMAGAGIGLPGAVAADDDADDEEEEKGEGGKRADTGPAIPMPQERAARFVGDSALLWRGLLGALCLVAAVAVAVVFGGGAEDDDVTRLPTLFWATLLLSQPLLALNLRSRRRPCIMIMAPAASSPSSCGGGGRGGGSAWVLWLWLAAAASLLALAALHSGLQRAMGLVALPARAWAGVVGSAVVATCWMEPVKCLGLDCFGAGCERKRKGSSHTAVTATTAAAAAAAGGGGPLPAVSSSTRYGAMTMGDSGGGDGSGAVARDASAVEGENAPLLGGPR